MELNCGAPVQVLFGKLPASYPLYPQVFGKDKYKEPDEGSALYEDFNNNYHVHPAPKTTTEIEDTCVRYAMNFINIERVFMNKADYDRLEARLEKAQEVTMVVTKSDGTKVRL